MSFWSFSAHDERHWYCWIYSLMESIGKLCLKKSNFHGEKWKNIQGIKKISPQKENSTTRKDLQSRKMISNWKLQKLKVTSSHKDALSFTSSHASSKGLSTSIKILSFHLSHTPHKITNLPQNSPSITNRRIH